MSDEDLYSILGVDPNATKNLLKQRYQQLILKYHPDKNGGNTEDRFTKIRTAWDILSDDNERRRYDAQRKTNDIGDDGNVWKSLTVGEMQKVEEMWTEECRCGGEFMLSEEEVSLPWTLVDCDTCSLVIKVYPDQY